MMTINEHKVKPDRKKSPAIVDAIDFNLALKPYRKFKLDNGVEVYSVDAGAEELLMLEWVFFAGTTMEEQNLVAASTNFLLKNGTSQKTAFQINEHFEYYGSYLNRACYSETATLTLHTLNKYISELLPVVRELICSSVMPEEELAIYRQNMKQRLKVNLKKSDFLAGRLIDTYLYGENHPYGKFSREEDFNALQREQLLAFYDTFYRKGKWILFAAGKLPANLPEELNKYFGDLPFQQVTGLEKPAVSAIEKKYRITNNAE